MKHTWRRKKALWALTVLVDRVQNGEPPITYGELAVRVRHVDAETEVVFISPGRDGSWLSASSSLCRVWAAVGWAMALCGCRDGIVQLCDASGPGEAASAVEQCASAERS